MMSGRSLSPRPRLGLLLALALSCACGSKGSAARDAGAGSDAAPTVKAPPAPLPAVRLSVTDIVVGKELGWERSLEPLPEGFVRTEVDKALGGSPLLEKGGTSARLKIRVGAGHAPEDPGIVRVAVQVTMTWKEGGEDRTLEARVVGEKEGGDGNVLVKAALPRAIADAVTSLVRKDGIRRGDQAAVIAALDDADPEVRSEALRAVADRKLHAAAPRLIELLASEDSDRADEALGALVALKEEGAVKAIVDRVQFSDIDSMRRIIDAVAEIGGDEAEAYLQFVAEGHEMGGVKDLAADALRRLRARKDKVKP
jgi:hypothetical protein